MNTTKNDEFKGKSSGRNFAIASVALVIGVAIGNKLLPTERIGSYGTSEEDSELAEVVSSAPSWSSLPDWSGVWAEDGNTIFDHASVVPPGSSAANRGTRDVPPSSVALGFRVRG